MTDFTENIIAMSNPIKLDIIRENELTINIEMIKITINSYASIYLYIFPK